MNHPTRTGRVDIVATTACLGALACWSIGPIFIKYLSSTVDSWTQNAVRYLAACLFFLPLLVRTIAAGELPPATWRWALLPSVANVGMQSCWAAGFYYLDPAFMTLLTKTSVVWVACFSLVAFPEERPLARSPRFWLGLLLSLTGVSGVLYFSGSFSTAGRLLGIALALMEGFLWALYTVSVRMIFQGVEARVSFSVISLYTTVGLCACALLFGQPAQALDLSVMGWAVVAISAVTAIALGHVLYYTAMLRIGATIPMLVILAQPFVVLSMSSVLYDEHLNTRQFLCGVILLLGSGFSVWSQQHLRGVSQVDTRKCLQENGLHESGAS